MVGLLSGGGAALTTGYQLISLRDEDNARIPSCQCKELAMEFEPRSHPAAYAAGSPETEQYWPLGGIEPE